MSEDLPFSAEYAKSDRSSCKTCGGKIPKDHVRIAVMVQSTHFDGKMPMWNHFNCFFRKNNLKSTGDMKGFGSLRYEDQAKIKDKVGGNVSIGKGQTVSADVSVEYAKSARSECRGCFTTIEKGVVRIGCQIDAEGKELKWAKLGKKQVWHHPACFVQRKDELKIESGLTADILDGFNTLKEEDKAELILLLGKGGKRKRKAKENSGQSKPLSAHEKKLKAQSNYMMEIRQALKEVNNKYLREMLEVNSYPTHGADIRLIDRCSDGIAFGRFNESCSVCGSQYFSLGNNNYTCKGDVSEFTKCSNTLAAPTRTLWVIPKSVKEQSSYLAKLKLKTGTRLFMEAEPSSAAASQPESAPHFQDYVFCCPLETVDIDGNDHEIRPLVTKHGGKVYKKFTAKCNVLITDDVDSKIGKRAAGLEIPVVDVVKLVKGLTGSELPDISTICFPGFEGDDYVKKRRSIKNLKENAKEEKSSKRENSNKRAKITVQNGAEVFSESGLHGNPNVQVYKDTREVVYAATLGMVDIAQGKNSYYKLQVLKRGELKYDLFRAWGRIGTDIGGTKFDTFNSPRGAVDLFMFHYEEKTGNDWGSPFEKVAGRMYRIDLDYGPSEDLDDKTVKPGSLTKLEPGLQSLVNLIFDVKAMKDTLMQFEIDLNKMPLGKLSKKQIKEAFTVLTAVLDYIEDPVANKIMIVDASTRFFTLIPHDFGMQKPPVLNSKELIQSKTGMLEALLELEIAFSMTRTEAADKGKDPIDTYFLKLKCEMSILPRDTEEFSLLEQYVSSTHADTHNQYQLQIENIFKVERQGEYSRYISPDAKFHSASYNTLHNRMLLWHGSRISNFAGILSQGLRIAPPEAPVTGYMFGKGVYFADMVSKSANYCCTSPSSPTGLLLLCEVALGEMYTLNHAKYINKPPKGKHSTKGCGRTGPSSYHTLSDGCVVPLGPGTDQPDAEDSSLLYNEFIVYDVAQINVKYLFQLKFLYQSRR